MECYLKKYNVYANANQAKIYDKIPLVLLDLKTDPKRMLLLHHY